jgi:hypothetical protein
MPSKLITENKQIQHMEASKAEALILTNVDHVIPMDMVMSFGKRKISVHIINDQSTKGNKPFFLVSYHGDSDGKELKKDMTDITGAIADLRFNIQTEHNIEIDDVVVMGDFNVSILKKQDGTISIDEDTLKTAITPAWDKNFELKDIALPEGVMSKMRGGQEGTPYNLYINPQAKKEKKLVENDSKEYILHFSFNDQLDNRSELDLTFTSLITNKMTNSNFYDKNFLTDNTNYRDHAPSNLITVQGVTLCADGLLPTDGAKGIKNPDDVYAREFLTSDGHLNYAVDIRSLQENSTSTLFYYLSLGFGVEIPHGLSTHKDITAFFDALKQKAISITQQDNGTVSLIEELSDVIKYWCKSPQYKQMLDATNDAHKQKVGKGIDKIQESLSTLVAEFVNGNKKNAPFQLDLFAELIKKIAQAQAQELTGGYGQINGKMPTRDDVVEKNTQVTLEQAKQKLGKPFFILTTEGTKKNQHENFKKGVHEGTVALTFSQWHAQLDAYLVEKAKSNYFSDRMYPPTKKNREDDVADVKAFLSSYAQTLINEAFSSQDDMMFLNHVLKNILEIKHLHSNDVELSSLLNHITIELRRHLVQRQQPFSYNLDTMRDDESSKFREKLLSLDDLIKNKNDIRQHYIDNGSDPQAKEIFNRISAFANHIDTFPESEEKTACKKLAIHMTDAVEGYVNSYRSGDDIKSLQTQIQHLVHSQDAWMTTRRSYYGLVADIITAVMTLGVFHLAHFAYQKCSSEHAGNHHLGFFHKPTTRATLLQQLEQSVEMKATSSNGSDNLLEPAEDPYVYDHDRVLSRV